MQQSGVPTKQITYDYTSGTVATNAYTQILAAASNGNDTSWVDIFDSSGSAIILAIGASGSEQNILYIPPGGWDNRRALVISKGVRLSIKALDTAASAGRLIINCFT